ncbi:meiosis expressed gene 1 protein homolog isoform X2 [Mastacembelus armatus]|uniref:meiosis expressed gene 1 protein homolog isoform X2 n=1 Tax=Mastacembelus armatus TaxID=205130 RepID=UPI000E4610AE|nr:meiosis expressed gene 1 protein homolog isoform X2 [Mastacembelus armatus]
MWRQKNKLHKRFMSGKPSLLTMSHATDNNSKPKSMSRAKRWTAEVENLFRFQEAGYRDELEYIQVKPGASIDKWPETGFVKKLQRRDNTFYYYSKKRECQDHDVHKVKVYAH